MKKILFMNHAAVVGGALVSLGVLVKGFASDRFFKKVLTINRLTQEYFQDHSNADSVELISEPAKTLGKYLIWAGFRIEKQYLKRLVYDIIHFPGLINLYRDRFREEKPDIVHLNSAIMFLPAIAAKTEGIPVIWHIREMVTGKKFNPRKLFVEYLINKYSDEVIGISSSSFANLQVKQSKRNVIYNSVNIEQFLTDKDAINYREKLNIPSLACVFVTLGGINFRKGLAEILEAFKTINKTNVHLIVAGPKPTSLNSIQISAKIIRALKWEDKLIELGLKTYRKKHYSQRITLAYDSLKDEQKQRVHFLGNINHVSALINSSDCLLFCGTNPHFPRPIYEAWLLKKPVICFDVEGIIDEVEHDKDALVTKPDSKSLHSIMNLFLSNPDSFDSLGKSGYEKAMKRFNSEKNSELFAKLVDKL